MMNNTQASIAAICMAAGVLCAPWSIARAQTASPTGQPLTSRPVYSQPLVKRPGQPSTVNFPSRGYGAKAPLMRLGMPNNYAIGGNRPAERTLPPRLNPEPTVAVPFPNPGSSAGGDPPTQPNVIDLPTSTGVVINTSVMAPGGLIWGTPIAIHRDASTSYARGWNRNANDQPAFDQRLSIHYKPSELASLQAQALAEKEASKVPLSTRAESALAKGDLELARELYLELLAQSPDDLRASRTLGVIDLMSKRTDEGIKRLNMVYASDPLLVDEPIDADGYPGGATAMRRMSSDVANLAVRGERADAAFVAAILAQSRNERAVAMRFVDRAADGALDPVLLARLRASLEEPAPTRSGAVQRR